VDGVNYYFLSREDFLKKVDNGEFLEYETYADNLYGTLKSEVSRINQLGRGVIFETEPLGAYNIKQMLDESLVDFFVAPSDEATLEKMLRNRKTDSEEQIQKRMKTALNIELPMQNKFSYVVVNKFGELENTLNFVKDKIGF
jgi:guanylate kinase